MCFFIPLQFGCPTKISQVEDQKSDIRICPQCHNGSVYTCKTRTWFEFCFVPLIPFKSKQIWLCSICRWQAIKDENPDNGPPKVPGNPTNNNTYQTQVPMNLGSKPTT
ncbi:uncharacterized protein MELLADRAFT_110840 [Melampsora larici-populina 98AG31]|uniref:Zinc-ribbon 15 domain-containing protein n=1 Tax=Melampsora larici-populina (strain 98AG31 / pathotype 3-4-7) TaxID=747676 RepID=F4S152_MELLP|nr:uncharacterized protein MELLADRAFT_110840 [Melampsora larici-populina 98AG31]EGG01629.1 hypothetical protein MELLADRAFT_110840 [Melampsora larici-populina 98AG31]